MVADFDVICSLFPVLLKIFREAIIVSPIDCAKGSSVSILILRIIFPSKEAYGFCIRFLYVFFLTLFLGNVAGTGKTKR
jgi:hypothetical protein